jgi:hypothetical protein
MAKELFIPPPFAPGEKVAQALHAGLYAVKSAVFNFDDVDTALFNVPANVLIVDLIVHVITAFDGTTPDSSATLGDGDDADGFMDATAANIETAGWKSMKQDTQPYSGGKEYTAADTIDIDYTAGGSVSQGSLEVWAIYKPLSTEDLANR